MTTSSYTVTAQDLGDFSYTFDVQATSSSDAMNQVKKASPGLFPYLAKLTKKMKTFEVTGLVDGKSVTTKLIASGVTDSEIEKSAIKFYKKLNGGFKRVNKKNVEVTTLVVIAA